MLVADASALQPALSDDDGPDGDRARHRLRGEVLLAPELVDLEVASVIRRQHRVGNLDRRRAELRWRTSLRFPSAGSATDSWSTAAGSCGTT